MVETVSVTENNDGAVENLPQLIEKKVAVNWNIYIYIYIIFQQKGVDDLLEELHFLLSSGSVPVTTQTIKQFLNIYNLHIDQAFMEELAKSVSVSHPVAKVLGKCGPLALSYKRKYYKLLECNVIMKCHFNISLYSSYCRKY